MPSERLIAAYADVTGKKPTQPRGCFNCRNWTTKQTELGTVPHCEIYACHTGKYAGGMCVEHKTKEGNS